jgi:hypothetical protein
MVSTLAKRIRRNSRTNRSNTVRRAWSLLLPPPFGLISVVVILGSKFALLGRPFYMSYIWSMKVCIVDESFQPSARPLSDLIPKLIYYTRLTSRTKELLAVQITAGFVAVAWVACMLTFFLECRPTHFYWQVLPYAPQCAVRCSFPMIQSRY